MSQGLSPGVGSQAQRLAEALKSAEREKGISRRDLAREMMTPTSTVASMKSQITKWANGTHHPSDLNAERIAHALNQLLGRIAYDPDYFKKDPNAPKTWELAARLATLEAKVETQGEATTQAIDALAKEVRALAPRLKAEGARATRKQPAR